MSSKRFRLGTRARMSSKRGSKAGKSAQHAASAVISDQERKLIICRR